MLLAVNGVNKHCPPRVSGAGSAFANQRPPRVVCRPRAPRPTSQRVPRHCGRLGSVDSRVKRETKQVRDEEPKKGGSGGAVDALLEGVERGSSVRARAAEQRAGSARCLLPGADSVRQRCAGTRSAVGGVIERRNRRRKQRRDAACSGERCA